MRVRWLGQSGFHLAARGLRFSYPVERDLPAGLLVVTHEHADLLDGAAFATDELPGGDAPLAVVPKL